MGVVMNHYMDSYAYLTNQDFTEGNLWVLFVSLVKVYHLYSSR